MRVLHLTPELPYWPGGSGGSTRQFHLLRRLAELGHEVAVVAPLTRAQEKAAAALEAAGLELLSYRRPASRPREALRALGREPALAPRLLTRPLLAWQVSVFWSALRPIAREAIRDKRPDVVTVEHDHAAAWMADLPRDVPALLTFQNVGWRYYESRARAAPRVQRPVLLLEAWRFRRFDARYAAGYRRLVAVSEPDQEALGELPVPAEVVPNGVATDEIEPQPEPSGQPTLLFTGTMAYPPNAEGIVWFAREVWPHICRGEPDARLLVVGRAPPRQVRELGRDARIEVTGAVREMAPHFARATAVVVPVLSGGGTRLKVLEAMAARRAIVSTSLGVEGLDVRPGEEVLVEDEPGAFAAAALRLLSDGALRARTAGAARRMAEERYDWRVLGERLEAVLSGFGPGASAPRPPFRRNDGLGGIRAASMACPCTSASPC